MKTRLVTTVLRNAHEGVLSFFPRNRRKVAYERGTETFLHSFWKFPLGMTITLLMLDAAGVVDTRKIFNAILNGNVLVLFAFLVGATVTGLAAGGASFRKWGANPDPLMEKKSRGRPPKTAS